MNNKFKEALMGKNLSRLKPLRTKYYPWVSEVLRISISSVSYFKGIGKCLACLLHFICCETWAIISTYRKCRIDYSWYQATNYAKFTQYQMMFHITDVTNICHSFSYQIFFWKQCISQFYFCGFSAIYELNKRFITSWI